MKRVNVLYDGHQYSVGEAEVEALKEAVTEAYRSGGPSWVTLNLGEGRPQPAELLIGPGIPISVVPIPADD
ncbi:hypothetical protein GE115_14135 [Agromyces sp. CFH 90414]|uniref:Uncharacterized protein n=1 Tax=Agromyces agglutinans TaxID=2662258 RepID=A0A6I2FEP7_9MICO|nr:hypothetical protein [Agromyces agglutinans]MRG60996.1 hypothetical protein [Agromyces agglutinans]